MVRQWKESVEDKEAETRRFCCNKKYAQDFHNSLYLSLIGVKCLADTQKACLLHYMYPIHAILMYKCIWQNVQSISHMTFLYKKSNRDQHYHILLFMPVYNKWRLFIAKNHTQTLYEKKDRRAVDCLKYIFLLFLSRL